jgi:hypothetical protein
MTEAELKANWIYNKYYSQFLQLDYEVDLKGGKKHAKKCALIHVKDTLDLLSSMRATKQILKQYRLYTEVKFKIEAIK